MGIRKYKPTSPGRRFGSVSDFKEITKKKPEKSLLSPLKKTAGRNVYGRITSRHRGAGHKRRYRIIDFKRDKDGVIAKVVSIEYDPNRSCRIALLQYRDGEKRYILSPLGLSVGDEVISGENAEIKTGNCMPLKSIRTGVLIHNIEMRKGRGGQLVRSAGGQAQLKAKEGNYVHILLPSGELRKIHMECRATIGQLGNIEHQGRSIGKAGRSRHKGRRPHTRGMSMNPVAHPMGGGEGRSKGHIPRSPSGKPAKGGKTRKPKKLSNKHIIRRRKSKQ